MTRSIVITGASKGIGRAAAEGLAAAGWEVIGIARHTPTNFQGNSCLPTSVIRKAPQSSLQNNGMPERRTGNRTSLYEANLGFEFKMRRGSPGVK